MILLDNWDLCSGEPFLPGTNTRALNRAGKATAAGRDTCRQMGVGVGEKEGQGGQLPLPFCTSPSEIHLIYLSRQARTFTGPGMWS